jgi:hypothetical protein
MEIKELIFLIYRMMPFIIVAFLVITSLFSGELSGFLVLVGILLSSLLTIGASNFSFVQDEILSKKDKILDCSILTINGGPLSYLPLSTHIFTFIWGYFLYSIIINSVVTNNGFLIALMTILVAIDFGYNWTGCVGWLWVFPALIGVMSGVLWAIIIGKNNQMVPQQDLASKCNVSKGMYRCKIKRTGQIIK